jgi:hypothetical protein
MNDDSDLQKRLHDLREDDAASAPSFSEMLRRSVTLPRPRWPRPAWLGAAAAAVAAAAVLWWPRPSRETLPEVSPDALANLESIEWTTPTDALLAGTNAPSVPALSREIEQLLNQP